MTYIDLSLLSAVNKIKVLVLHLLSELFITWLEKSLHVGAEILQLNWKKERVSMCKHKVFKNEKEKS